MQKHASDRKRIITPQVDRHISIVEKRNKNGSPSQIAKDLAIATYTRVSTRTILLQLKRVYFYAQKPVQCIPVEPRYLPKRLRRCKEHISWGHQQ